MKNKLYVPHIDKTGGTSFIEMLFNALRKAKWEITTSAYFPELPKDERRTIAESQMPPMKIGDELPQKYARIGMHHVYQPEIINDDWFKLLVIREPLPRFVSSFNFFIWEIWRDTGSFYNISMDEYIDLVLQKNLGLNTLAAHHLQCDDIPFKVIKNYADTILTQFPWNVLLEPRGYISSVISLNAETPGNLFTNTNIFDVFDVIIDTSRIPELDMIMQQNIGVAVNIDLQRNTKEQNASLMNFNTPLTVKDISPEQLIAIEAIPTYQDEMELWDLYRNSKHAR